MAGYGGYFMQGLSSGIQSGFDMGMMKWQQKKKQEVDDLNAKMADTWSNITKEMSVLGEDGSLSEDDLMKINVLSYAAPYQMQAEMQKLRTSLKENNRSDYDKQYNMITTFMDWAEGQDYADVSGLYESMRSQITDEHALTLYEVGDKKLRHEPNQVAQQPSFATPEEAMAGGGGGSGYKWDKDAGGFISTYQKPTTPETPTSSPDKAITYLKKLNVKKMTDAQFEAVKKDAEKHFNTDLSNITKEFLYEDKTTTTPKTEEPNEVLFGTNGIMKDYINSGSQLGEEQKVEIKNNYDIMKPSLTADVQKQVEDYLLQVGIDVNAQAQVEPTPEPEAQP